MGSYVNGWYVDPKLALWSAQYVQTLVNEAGYRTNLREWWETDSMGINRLVGYIHEYNLPDGFAWKYRDWCLIEAYHTEMLDYWVGTFLREIREELYKLGRD